jgi:flagellar M-ring protein FliF
VNSLFELLRGLGSGRLIAMGGMAAGLVGFFIYIAVQVGTPPMALLYGGLDLEDSADIATTLDGMGIPYEVLGNGSQIMVPEGDVARLRLTLASEGLPTGGNVGYEIFDQGGALGTTSFVQEVNLVRALEGELARTIRTLDLVAGARIHLVLPKRELFQRDTRDPSASIILTMRGGRRLEAGQVLAIQHLVAAAVPELMPSQISIIDDQGGLLARADEEDIAGDGRTGRIDEFRIAFERRLKTNIETMLERSLGAGKVWAEVSVDLNHNQVTKNEEFFDPNGQVARSTQTIEDANEARDARGAQPVTVAQNLPDAAGANDAGVNETNSLRTEETVNFEITRTMTETVTNAGALTRLSVAVMVDGTYIGIAPEDSYVARSEIEVEQITELVRSAVGFDADRGDQVSVINMQFARMEAQEVVEVEAFLGLGRDDYFRVAELMIFAIIAMLVVLLVFRPLVSRALSIAQAVAQAAAAEQAAEAQLIAQQQAALGAPGMEGAEPVSEVEQMIGLAQVEGRVRASSLKKVGELVDDHPEEALAIIRNWLYQG